MKIAVVGRGNVGGGLAALWEQAGHEVKRIGREGGDVSEAEVVVVAVPGGTIAEALDNVRGMEGKTVIDATNLVGVDPPEGFSSNAEFVKSKPTVRQRSLSTPTLQRSTIGLAKRTRHRATCGAATRRRGRLSSSSTEM
jgi:hypothetical protein